MPWRRTVFKSTMQGEFLSRSLRSEKRSWVKFSRYVFQLAVPDGHAPAVVTDGSRVESAMKLAGSFPLLSSSLASKSLERRAEIAAITRKEARDNPCAVRHAHAGREVC